MPQKYWFNVPQNKHSKYEGTTWFYSLDSKKKNYTKN